MTEQEKERAQRIIQEQREIDSWPKFEALDDEFGFRVYGYGRSPEQVWLWVIVTLSFAALAIFIGWQYGRDTGERLFDGPLSITSGQLFFSLLFVVGVITFIRTIAVRFFEKLIEKRFDIALTRDKVEIGGWFGYKPYYKNSDGEPVIRIEDHKEAEYEMAQSGGAVQTKKTGRYATTKEVVLWHSGKRKVIASFCRDEESATFLLISLQKLNGQLRSSTGRPGEN